MKAILLEGPNQPFVFRDVETPVAKPGEVLVQLKAASLNRRDYWIHEGKYAGIGYPMVPGADGAGVVTEAADDEGKQWIGEEVIIYPAYGWHGNQDHQSDDFAIIGLPPYQGTFAEYISVPLNRLHKKPAYLNWEQAAAFPVAGLTAFRALFRKGQAAHGDKVLITGVGGGAGTFALQYAVAAGCQVFITSGSSQKIERARKLGATAGVNYKAQDWADQLAQLSGGGFDVIIDSALGPNFEKLIDLCKPGGRIVFFGGTAGNIPELNGRKIFWNHISILGTTLGSPAQMDEMLAFCKQHHITPVVDEVFALADAEKAAGQMAQSNQFGKLVFTI